MVAPVPAQAEDDFVEDQGLLEDVIRLAVLVADVRAGVLVGKLGRPGAFFVDERDARAIVDGGQEPLGVEPGEDRAEDVELDTFVLELLRRVGLTDRTDPAEANSAPIAVSMYDCPLMLWKIP